MAKKHYNRQFMRKHYASGIYVSNDGKHFERDYFDKQLGIKKTYEPKISIVNGRNAFHFRDGSVFYVDEVVLEAYKGRAPKDGKIYTVNHKDGDWNNSDAKNLEWVEETPVFVQQRVNAITMTRYKSLKISVSKNGTIKQGSQVLKLQDCRDDRDLDWSFHTTNPWIEYSYENRWGRIESERLNVDIIMTDFGLVEGDSAKFQEPVIIHKNNDYMDFTPGNLEWCDKTEQRYIDYQKIAHDVAMKKDHDINHRLTQTSWVSVYGPNEPFQDWVDRPWR